MVIMFKFSLSRMEPSGSLNLCLKKICLYLQLIAKVLTDNPIFSTMQKKPRKEWLKKRISTRALRKREIRILDFKACLSELLNLPSGPGPNMTTELTTTSLKCCRRGAKYKIQVSSLIPSASSDHYFDFKIVLLCAILKSGDGRMGHVWKQRFRL